MVGDAQVGKTTLMVKYVENKFDEEYIMTLGEIALASWPDICRETAVSYHESRVCATVVWRWPSSSVGYRI